MRFFREGATHSLSEVDGFEIVAEGSSSADAIQIAETFCPDILLMDISMTGNGLDAIPAILKIAPSQRIVVLTVPETGDDVTMALERGAAGYILKGIGAEALAEAVRTVASGQSFVTPTVAAKLIIARGQEITDKSTLIASLTPRERQVLELVAVGASNKHIATRLNLQKKTVKHHMPQIFTKLSVTNRTEAAMALRDSRQA